MAVQQGVTEVWQTGKIMTLSSCAEGRRWRMYHLLQPMEEELNCLRANFVVCSSACEWPRPKWRARLSQHPSGREGTCCAGSPLRFNLWSTAVARSDLWWPLNFAGRLCDLDTSVTGWKEFTLHLGSRSRYLCDVTSSNTVCIRRLWICFTGLDVSLVPPLPVPFFNNLCGS